MHDVFLVPSQFATIQSAVDAVARASTIVISPGVYAEDIRVQGRESVVIQSALFGRRGVTIGSISIGRSSVWLSGLAVRGRGISADESSISLQECVVSGEGLAMTCRNSAVRVQKSMIGGNSGGGLHLIDCKVEIAGSSIQANGGIGIRCQRCAMRMWRSRVTDNAGIGIHFLDPAGARIGGGVITGTDGGGIVLEGDASPVEILRDSVVLRHYPQDVSVLPPAAAAAAGSPRATRLGRA